MSRLLRSNGASPEPAAFLRTNCFPPNSGLKAISKNRVVWSFIEAHENTDSTFRLRGKREVVAISGWISRVGLVNKIYRHARYDIVDNRHPLIPPWQLYTLKDPRNETEDSDPVTPRGNCF